MQGGILDSQFPPCYQADLFPESVPISFSRVFYTQDLQMLVKSVLDFLKWVFLTCAFCTLLFEVLIYYTVILRYFTYGISAFIGQLKWFVMKMFGLSSCLILVCEVSTAGWFACRKEWFWFGMCWIQILSEIAQELCPLVFTWKSNSRHGKIKWTTPDKLVAVNMHLLPQFPVKVSNCGNTTWEDSRLWWLTFFSVLGHAN